MVLLVAVAVAVAVVLEDVSVVMPVLLCLC